MTKKPPIEAIIFDLGGVLIDIDPPKTLERFRQLGMANVEHVFHELTESGWFHRLERGEVTPVQIREQLRQVSGLPLTDEQIEEAWKELLGPIPKERMELVEALESRYPLYLLSNTNVPHMEEIHRYVQQTFGKPHMGAWFRKAYYSFDVGMRKPDRAIFEHVLTDSALEAETTLFVDDTEKNIHAAAALGLQTIYIRPDYPVTLALQNFLL